MAGKTAWGPQGGGQRATAGEGVITGYDKSGRPVRSEPSAQISSGGGGQWGEDVFSSLAEKLAGQGYGDLMSGAHRWRGWGGQNRFDVNADMMSISDKMNEDRGLRNETASLQNALLRRQLNPDKVVGAGVGIGGGGGRVGPGGAIVPDAPFSGRRGKQAWERVEEEKDFASEFAHQRMLAELQNKMSLQQQQQKLSLLQGLFGQFMSKNGGGTLTNTDQQIVNNAGSWEPRNVTSTRQIPPTEILSALRGLL